jgi:predicted transglutaminase-like cysteine proteinase
MHCARSKAFGIPFKILFVIAVSVGPAVAEGSIPAPTTAIIQGIRVEPPLSYLDFCDRHADQCGQMEGRLVAESSYHGPMTAADRENVINPSSTRTSAALAGRFDWQLVFAATHSIETRPNSPMQAGIDGGSKPNGLFPAMTPEFWQQLHRVNTKVNVGVRSVSDIAHYGVEDFWELPFDGGGNAGDCEDYVLQKRKMLISSGIPMAALSIALVKTSWNEPHAVLLMHTAQGDYVMDNLTPLIEPWKAVSYTWIKWQSSENPDIWVRSAMP